MNLVGLNAGDYLNGPQQELILRFVRAVNERHLFDYRVPAGAAMWFYSPTLETAPIAFLWAQRQVREEGGQILRVHALYIDKAVPHDLSKWITELFESALDGFAEAAGITELGFYTRRNPQAFMRRLGHGWKLDSYVLKRPLRLSVKDT